MFYTQKMKTYRYLETKVPVSKQGPLYKSPQFEALKDPCILFDDNLWHIYGTGSRGFNAPCRISHATAPRITGPWTEAPEVILIDIEGYCVAAPGMIYDTEEKLFHMFIQSTCFQLDGVIYHATSSDGTHFMRKDIALTSLPKSKEAGIYDSHPAIINGHKYLCYAGMEIVGHPEIFLARSTTNTWDGPWERLGCILRHKDIPHHNQPGTPNYEWGIEGAQLVELPNGSVLLNAVCFLPEGENGRRQRVFFALAKRPTGPYISLGPLLTAEGESWESGENGHASAIVNDNYLHLFYQAQSSNSPWNIGYAVMNCADITTALRKRDRLRRRFRTFSLTIHRRLEKLQRSF